MIFEHIYTSDTQRKVHLSLSSGDQLINATGVVYTPVSGLVIEPESPVDQLVYELNSDIIFVARIESGDHLAFTWSTTATGVEVVER